MKINKGFKKTKLFEWQERGARGGICNKCGRTVARLTVDHIVPVSIIEMLDNFYDIMVEDEENFQYLCQPCNSMKSSRVDITNPKTAKLLLKYIQPYL